MLPNERSNLFLNPLHRLVVITQLSPSLETINPVQEFNGVSFAVR